MMNLIRLSGLWGYILTLLGFVVLFLSVRAAGRLVRGPSPGPRLLQEDLNGLLFWGGVTAIVGFLGQCQGAYLALEAILQATEVSPNVIAEGFVISFVPTLFGLGILGFSLSAWGCLRLLARGRLRGTGVPLTLALAIPILLSGCADERVRLDPEALVGGVWSFEAGPDEFLWEFSRDGTGVTCIVHDMVGPTKLNETPCRTAEMDGGQVLVSMDTGVRLAGELFGNPKRLVGALFYPDGSELEIEFPWHPREDYSGLLPLDPASLPYTYSPPTQGGDGWAVSSAADEGVDPRALEDAVAAIVQGDAGVVHSLLVAHRGKLVMEEYFHGYAPDDLHHLASCTKSVSSLLTGLAIQQGSIPGVDAPLLGFFPDLSQDAGQGWEDLTLQDLLTMSLALDWSPREAETLHGSGPDFFQRILSRSVSGEPGADWAYVSANVNLLAGVLHQATGRHAEAFAQEALFGPLGIESWNWDGMKTNGFNLMDGSLRLRPRDMAKIGQMVLAGGAWNGVQVVDESWIQESTSHHLDADDGTQGYGYLWWRMDAEVPGEPPEPVILANGWGSQFIAIVPSRELVIVTTGGNEYNGKHLAPAGLMERFVLPGVNRTRG